MSFTHFIHTLIFFIHFIIINSISIKVRITYVGNFKYAYDNHNSYRKLIVNNTFSCKLTLYLFLNSNHESGRWLLQRSCQSFGNILIKSSLFMFNLFLVSPTLFFPGFCAITLLDKGALTLKSFANILRLHLNLSFFKINSCLRTNLCKTEEWDILDEGGS